MSLARHSMGKVALNTIQVQAAGLHELLMHCLHMRFCVLGTLRSLRTASDETGQKCEPALTLTMIAADACQSCSNQLNVLAGPERSLRPPFSIEAVWILQLYRKEQHLVHHTNLQLGHAA